MTTAPRTETKPFILVVSPLLQETPLWPSGSLTQTPPEKIGAREMPGPGGQIPGGSREFECVSDKLST